MRTVSDGFKSRHSGRMVVRAESWLGPDLLASDIPIIGGSWRVESTADDALGGSLTFQVPRLPEWVPLDPGHPLAAYGQQIRFYAGWDRDGSPELVPLGTFRLASVTAAGAALTVDCESVLSIVDRAKFLYPYRADGLTRANTLRQMLQGLVPVSIEGLPVVEIVPAFVCEEDRLGGVLDVVESWPARIWIDDMGVIVISPPWTDQGDPVETVRDGEGGQIITLEVVPDPSPGINAIKVETIPEGDQAPIFEVSTITEGPMAYGGPYGYVTGRFASPALPADRSHLLNVGVAKLARSQRRRNSYRLDIPPALHLQVGDVIRITSTRQRLDVITRITHTAHSRSRTTLEAGFMREAR